MTFISIFFLFSCSEEPAIIEGDWFWDFTNEANHYHTTTLFLDQINEDVVRGNYCSTYYDGREMDCAKQIEDVYAIELKRVNKISFEGSFHSSLNEHKGKIRMTYFKSSKSILLDVLEEPDSRFFLPDEVHFEKNASIY